LAGPEPKADGKGSGEVKTFYLPTRIVTGEGCFDALAGHATQLGQRALLVCGAGSLRREGRLDQAVAALRSAGLAVTVYDAVSAEPTLDMVQRGMDLAHTDGSQVVIGIGGGSAMDTAKAIAGLCTHPFPIRAYFDGEREVGDGGLPWIGVPTTAGTGAEVTKNAVLSWPERNLKSSLRHDAWFARVVLVDPELTLTVPPDITAATGSDALTQAIESYTSTGAMEVTDALAEDAIRRIGCYLERAYRNGQDLAARAEMMYGSLLAGCAMSNARLGGVHGIAHPLGARHHIPHGVACGLLLPYVMAYNVTYATDKYARISRALGIGTGGQDPVSAAEGVVDAVRELLARVNMPQHLSRYGVSRESFAAIIQDSLSQGSLKSNPRPLAAQDVEAILSAAL
jgi:alcohol dehydrogenase class IV